MNSATAKSGPPSNPGHDCAVTRRRLSRSDRVSRIAQSDTKSADLISLRPSRRRIFGGLFSVPRRRVDSPSGGSPIAASPRQYRRIRPDFKTKPMSGASLDLTLLARLTKLCRFLCCDPNSRSVHPPPLLHRLFYNHHAVVSCFLDVRGGPIE